MILRGMSAPIFTPFIMDTLSRKTTPRRVVRNTNVGGAVMIQRRSSPGEQMHDSGSMRPSNVPPVSGPRYRVIQPVNARKIQNSGVGPMQPLGSSPAKFGPIVDMRIRKPKGSIGNGEPLGKNPAADQSFIKSSAHLPGKTRKRVYFDEDESAMSEKKPAPMNPAIRIVRRGEMRQPDEVDVIGHTEEVSTSDDKKVEVDEYDHDEVDIDGLEDDDEDETSMHRRLDNAAASAHQHQMMQQHQRSVPGVLSMNMHEDPMRVKRSHGSMMKQLSGENNYLKDQLDASFYRIKQLETLLIDRNMRLKQLLSENLMLSSKVKKLTNELGEDTVKELFAESQPSSSGQGNSRNSK